MEKKNKKNNDPNNQVHSEFETSIGNNFNIVREETLKRNKPADGNSPLNELPDEDSVKNEGDAGEAPPKMNAPEEKKD